jgi:hypothetical protein
MASAYDNIKQIQKILRSEYQMSDDQRREVERLRQRIELDLIKPEAVEGPYASAASVMTGF